MKLGQAAGVRLQATGQNPVFPEPDCTESSELDGVQGGPTERSEVRSLKSVACGRIALRDLGPAVSPQLIIVLVAAATMLAVVGGALLLVRRCWVAVPAGKALIVDRPGRGRLVSFNGMVVFPGIHHGELMDTSPRTIRIERRQ